MYVCYFHSTSFFKPFSIFMVILFLLLQKNPLIVVLDICVCYNLSSTLRVLQTFQNTIQIMCLVQLHSNKHLIFYLCVFGLIMKKCLLNSFRISFRVKFLVCYLFLLSIVCRPVKKCCFFFGLFFLFCVLHICSIY